MITKAELLAKARKYGASELEVDRLNRLMIGYDPGFDDKAVAALYAAFPPAREPGMETDEELRIRLVYVAGEAELAREIRFGGKLDDIAARYGLKRRKKETLSSRKTDPVYRVQDTYNFKKDDLW